MKIRRYRGEGLSVSGIARLVHHDRKTIRKALGRECTPLPRRRRGGKKKYEKLAPYMAFLQGRMASGVFNAAVLLDELRAVGYKGGLTVVKQYVRPFRPKRPLAVTVRFETGPGEQAQVDFIDVRFTEEDGQVAWRHIFSYVLGHSRLLYAEWTEREDALTFFRCLDRAFRATGGVPKEVLSDNLPPAVLGRDGDGAVVFTEGYRAFARHYGFTPRACRPYRAQTKGKVERTGRYIQENFLPRMAREVRHPDVDLLNRHLRAWLDTTANVRIHGTTHERPIDRFIRNEASFLRVLPLHPFGLDEVAARRVGADGFVEWKTNRYSVPWVLAHRDVMVHETPGRRIWVEFEGRKVAEAALLCGRHQIHEDGDHREGLLEAAKAQTGVVLKAPDVESYPLQLYELFAQGSVR